MYKSDASINPTLAPVLYKQAKTLQDFKNYTNQIFNQKSNLKSSWPFNSGIIKTIQNHSLGRQEAGR